MITELSFVTTNAGKFSEVQRSLKTLLPHLVLHQAPIDLPEIQGLDIETIAHYKALAAWQVLRRPLIVDDGGIFLDAYHLFPGALSKYVLQGIGMEGVLKLAEKDNRCHFTTCIAFCSSPDKVSYFKGSMSGTLAEKPAHLTVNSALPYRAYFTPLGSEQTYEELVQKGQLEESHHRLKALKAFVAWLSQQPS